MIAGMSDNTNENAGRIRIEPQPELVKNSEGAWVCDEKAFMDNDAMSEYLFEEIYIEGLGNSPDFECEPVLIDGVWYWEAWVLEATSNNG